MEKKELNLELQKEINSHLNEIVNTMFSNEDYDLTLTNLIRCVKFLTDDISDMVDKMDGDKTGKKDNVRFYNEINERCYSINTLCDTITEKLKADDFTVLYNLIYNQKQIMKA